VQAVIEAALNEVVADAACHHLPRSGPRLASHQYLMEVVMAGPKPQFTAQKVCSFTEEQVDAIEAAAADSYEGNSSAVIRAAINEWLTERGYLKAKKVAKRPAKNP
jgi:hypothetical protein